MINYDERILAEWVKAIASAEGTEGYYEGNLDREYRQVMHHLGLTEFVRVDGIEYNTLTAWGKMVAKGLK